MENNMDWIFGKNQEPENEKIESTDAWPQGIDAEVELIKIEEELNKANQKEADEVVSRYSKIQVNPNFYGNIRVPDISLPTKLRTSLSLDLLQDISAYFSIYAETELLSLLTENLCDEFVGFPQIIDDLGLQTSIDGLRDYIKFLGYHETTVYDPFNFSPKIIWCR